MLTTSLPVIPARKPGLMITPGCADVEGCVFPNQPATDIIHANIEARACVRHKYTGNKETPRIAMACTGSNTAIIIRTLNLETALL